MPAQAGAEFYGRKGAEAMFVSMHRVRSRARPPPRPRIDSEYFEDEDENEDEDDPNNFEAQRCKNSGENPSRRDLGVQRSGHDAIAEPAFGQDSDHGGVVRAERRFGQPQSQAE